MTRRGGIQRFATRCAATAGALALGCAGPQSSLAPAGRDAKVVADLFVWMAAGGALIWIAVVALAVYAVRARDRVHGQDAANALIVGGGVIVPTVVLAALLAYGLSLLPRMLALPPDGGLRIAVSGEQWWWRVRYEPPDGAPVELANEIRLPVGERVAIELASPDVIHSFWVPSLAGKLDLVPGRVNRLAVEPTRTGTFEGACAEYCGTSHAWMRLHVVVMEAPAFAAWLRQQREPAAPPSDALAAAGRDAFLENGCGACHTVRGTPADGTLGPDLTHVGSRLRLAAGVLRNDRAAFRRFVAETTDVKPGAHMPSFGMLPPRALDALATYLEGLE